MPSTSSEIHGDDERWERLVEAAFHADAGVGVNGSGASFEASFEASFDASFDAADQRRIRRLREILSAMRDAPLDRPPAAVRIAAIASFEHRGTLFQRWILGARRVLMDLVGDDPAVAVAGYRAASLPVRTYRVADSGGDQAFEAFLDIQIEAVSGSATRRRLRGQISVPENSPAAIAAHAIAAGTDAPVTTALVDEDGTFVLDVGGEPLDLFVELIDGERALIVRSI